MLCQAAKRRENAAHRVSGGLLCEMPVSAEGAPPILESVPTTPSAIRQHIVAAIRKIPRGKVSTYGDIARALGHPKAARAIGRIIANNPNPISIPCHRVVKSSGEIGGFAYGEQMKREILEKEGIKFQDRIVENFQEQRLSF